MLSNAIDTDSSVQTSLEMVEVVENVGNHESELKGLLAGFRGRPGLDSGTLRVFPERPGMSILVRIGHPEWGDIH